MFGMKPLNRNTHVSMRNTLEMDRMRFVKSCVAVWESISHSPVTLRIALRTMLGNDMQISTRSIVYTFDATPAQCVAGKKLSFMNGD